jgi:hypothetical protein
MKLKMLVLAVATTFVTISAPSVMACSTDAWSSGAGVTGSPVAGRPNDTTPTRRYSGVCGLRAPASGSFVTDNTPAAETVFRSRFYVYTGVTGGNAVVFRAANASDTPMITVTYDAAAASFGFTTTGGSGSVASIVANRWYSIELAWAATGATVPSGVTAGVMTATVQGAGAAAPTSATGSMTVPTPAPGPINATQIDTVQLGWISGTATAAAPVTVGARVFNGGITVDAYDSRRATVPPALCRGNAATADTTQTRNVFDISAIIGEMNGTLPSSAESTPDCTQDGLVNVFDISCVIGFMNSTPACS